MVFNDIEISPLALGTALQGSKIQAIKIVRDSAPAFIGLKEAKVAIEAAMAEFEPSEAASTVADLQRQLETTRRLRTQEADGWHAECQRLRQSLASAQVAQRRVEERLRLAEAAITDHIFGRSRLPDLAPSEYDDYGDEPF